MPEIVRIGNATLYHGDCMEIIPTLTDFDAVVTDPPYGIGASSGVGKYGVMKWGGKADLKWDEARFDALLAHFIGAEIPVIWWGGNHYETPSHTAPLIWDKGAGFEKKTFAECEVAFTNLSGVARIFKRDPLACGDYRNKAHPTQKPVPLMEWCLSFIPEAQTILDPFMGSGTTGVACINLGRKFVGIEKDAGYFKTACERIDAALSQGRLFA